MSKRKFSDEVTETLDAKTLAAVEEGIKAAQNGRRWTLEQTTEFARKRREAWKQIPEDLYHRTS